MHLRCKRGVRLPVSVKLDNLEDMPEYQCGIWYGTQVKIYHVGGHDRIAELGSYPRAYVDMELHVYTEDTLFIVAESDLNWFEDQTWYYRDSRGSLFTLGQEATHWMGDPLPGAFPKWIADEGIVWTPDPDYHIFPLGDMPRSILDLTDAVRKQGIGAYVHLTAEELEAVRDDLAGSQITIDRNGGDEDKQVLRILYRRRF